MRHKNKAMAVQNFPKHIFLADDDIDDRTLFADMVNEISEATTLTQFENGHQLTTFLDNILNPIPDMILLDLNMPVKDGFECLREIRSHHRNLSDLSVVVLTTSSDPYTMRQVFDLGATYYAVKPRKYTAMKSMVHEFMSIDWQSSRLNAESSFLIAPMNI